MSRLRLGHRLRRALDPGDPFGDAHLRVVSAAIRIRLVVGLLATVAVLVVPGAALSDRLVIAGILAGYVITVGIVDAVGDRMHWRTRVLDLLIGLAAIFVCSLLVPGLLAAALLAYVLAVVVDTCLAGLHGGIEASALAITLALIAQWQAPPAERLSAITLLLFALFLVTLVIVVDAITSERRRAAEDLERMQDALRSVTAAPGLEPTLDSVVRSVIEIVDAHVALILLREGDLLIPTVSSAAAVEWTRAAAVNVESDGPVTHAVRREGPVVVSHVTDDERYPAWSARWAGVMREAGITSVASVPLRAGADVIGVLVACFRFPVTEHDAELGLLEAYADQAGLVIVRAQAYEAEKHAAEELAAADRLKSEFLATVSHELRTPLTAAKGFVDTVLLHWDRLDDAQRRQMLRRASANADDLARQIEQLLDLSRIEAGAVEAILEDVELHTLVDEVLARLDPLLAGRRTVLDVPPHLTVCADPDAIRHVLENLLANAVRFSEPGSVVEIGARPTDGEVTIWVRDEGVGIEAADLSRIFERFEQAGPADRPRRGAGIGLAIVRSLVELQGGRVWAESTPGEGSLFRFTLPAAAARAERAVAS